MAVAVAVAVAVAASEAFDTIGFRAVSGGTIGFRAISGGVGLSRTFAEVISTSATAGGGGGGGFEGRNVPSSIFASCSSAVRALLRGLSGDTGRG